MSEFTYLSNHAAQRLGERTTMKKKELVELLDRGAFVNTGLAPGFNREHLLFWSEKDGQPFIAIRDKLYGEVVTVLPINYHTNLAWGIDNESVLAAKALAEKPTPPPGRNRDTTKDTPQEPLLRPTKIRLLARYMTEDLMVKVKKIGSYPIDKYGNAANLLKKLTDEEIKEACEKSGLNFNNCSAFVAREGRRAEAWRDMW